jgi:hypothetical protein
MKHLLTHLSFPVERGAPGFLMPIFTRGRQLFVQHITDEFDLSYSPVKSSDEYIGVSSSDLTIRFLEDMAKTSADEAIHAFFDGQVVVLGVETRMREFLLGNILDLYRRLRLSDPYALAGIFDFLGADEAAKRTRTALNANRELPKVLPNLHAAVAKSESVGAAPLSRVAHDNDKMLRQVRTFGNRAATYPSSFHPGSLELAAA